jgi:hypothetical protein
MKPNDDIFVKKRNDTLDTYTHVDEAKNQLDITISAGFFANCSITLSALTRAYPSERYMKVNWPCQDQWRNDDQVGKNLFDLYFEPNSDLDPNTLANLSPFRTHTVYRDLRFDKLTPYIENYFTPSEIARKKLNELVHKYEIDYDNTIGLCYRGTDKFTELVPVPPRYYVAEVLRLIRKNPRLKVLLLTDQEQIRDIFVRELGEHVFYFSELPVTKSLIAIHNISREDRGISNFELGITLLAVVNIFAKCRYVVTYTGNVSLWICLYRGTANNTCQLRPRLPNLISQYEDETGTRSESTTTRGNVYASIDEEEIYELRSENIELRSKNMDLLHELSTITTSFMYRCMAFLATKIDRLFPDNTVRGKFRKRITQALRHK